MATISSNEDIFTIHAPGRSKGDIVEVLDEENSPRRAILTVPMGDAFGFKWVDPEQRADTGDGKFVKQGSGWLIKTHQPHEPGDKVRIATQEGIKDIVLGIRADGENLFYRRNHFVRNPHGDDPKWCVRVYGGGAMSGDTVEVAKKDGSTQKQTLKDEVKPGIWTASKA